MRSNPRPAAARFYGMTPPQVPPPVPPRVARLLPTLLMVTTLLLLPACVEQSRTTTGLFRPKASGPTRTTHEIQPRESRDSSSDASRTTPQSRHLK